MLPVNCEMALSSLKPEILVASMASLLISGEMLWYLLARVSEIITGRKGCPETTDVSI